MAVKEPETFETGQVEFPVSAFIYCLVASGTVQLPRMEAIVAFVEGLDEESYAKLFTNVSLAWYSRDFASRLLVAMYNEGEKHENLLN